MYVKYSLVIPCFNEEKNIDNLILGCKNILNKPYFELILVNNGSIDKTFEKITKLTEYYTNIKCVNIKKNIGFGFGVFEGLNKSSGKIIGYTHADLQTDPNDFLRAIEIIEQNSSDHINFFIKGLRHGRSFTDIFFTRGMTFIMSILFFRYMHDITAQPVVFNRQLLEKCKIFPNNFTIDLYLYYVAKKYKYSIKRFKVSFPDRIYGIGNNDTLIKKIKNSILVMFQSVILRYKTLI